MFTKKTDIDKTALETEIDSVLAQMAPLEADAEEYAKMLAHLEKLYALKSLTKDNSVSSDTVLAIIGNLAGIGMILGYERAHIVTSKALGFVLKGKL